jgi:phage I-like protein
VFPSPRRGLTHAKWSIQMAQADSIANPSPTRRKALTAVATLAGAAAVVTPAVAAQAIAHPDAELLALGQQLRELFASHDVAERELLRLDDQLRERLYQAHGRPRMIGQP